MARNLRRSFWKRNVASALILLGIGAAPFSFSIDAHAKNGGHGGEGHGHEGHAKDHSKDSAGKSGNKEGAKNQQVNANTPNTPASPPQSNSKKSSAPGVPTGQSNIKSAGKLNGFLHASPSALKNASPNSAVGKVAIGVRDALTDYANGTGSLDDVAEALAKATNKPVTDDQVKAVIDKLAKNNPNTSLDGYTNGTLNEDQDAQEIADRVNEIKNQGNTETSSTASP